MEATQMSQTTQAAAPPAPRTETKRYLALDAYRGFIMLLLASEGFGFAELRNDATWGRVARWFNHVPWEGGVFWDMIQPSFMFMVGVAMPFALARRTELGATPQQNFRHVLGRSIRLVILSQILIWVSAGEIKPQLINVLSQIAFTYLLTYLIMRWPWRYQTLGFRPARGMDRIAFRLPWARWPVLPPGSHRTSRRPRHLSLRLRPSVLDTELSHQHGVDPGGCLGRPDAHE